MMDHDVDIAFIPHAMMDQVSLLHPAVQTKKCLFLFAVGIGFDMNAITDSCGLEEEE